MGRSLNRTFLPFAVGVGVLLTVLTSLVLSTLWTLQKSSEALVASSQRAELFGQFEASLVRAAGDAAAFAGTRHASYLDEAHDALERARNAVALLESDAGAYGDTESASGTYRTIRQRQSELLANLADGIRAIEQAPAFGDPAIVHTELERVFAYEASAKQLRIETQALLENERLASQAAVHEALRRATIAIGALVGLLVLFQIGAALMAQYGIVKPVVELSRVARELAAGNLDQTVTVTTSDEIGVLQATFNHMIADLRVAFAERDRALEESLRDKASAEAANRAKSTFLASMSHELRTPLTAIIGYGELLQIQLQGQGPSDALADVERIGRASQHLLALINTILDFAKIEAGRIDIHVETFDILSLVDELATTVQPIVARNGNTLRVDCTSGLRAMQGDLIKIRQVLLNLLGNAAKFTRNGMITLTVDQEQRDSADWVRFRVIDTGGGIAADQIPRLFQPFAQLETPTMRTHGGTGLGLAISHRLCQILGGDISVDSQLGAGSTFTVRLPIAGDTC